MQGSSPSSLGEEGGTTEGGGEAVVAAAGAAVAATAAVRRAVTAVAAMAVAVVVVVAGVVAVGAVGEAVVVGGAAAVVEVEAAGVGAAAVAAEEVGVAVGEVAADVVVEVLGVEVLVVLEEAGGVEVEASTGLPFDLLQLECNLGYKQSRAALSDQASWLWHAVSVTEVRFARTSINFCIESNVSVKYGTLLFHRYKAKLLHYMHTLSIVISVRINGSIASDDGIYVLFVRSENREEKWHNLAQRTV